MHNAFYQGFFLLAWYNDITYKVDDNGLSKAFPILYCNKSSCQSAKLDVL